MSATSHGMEVVSKVLVNGNSSGDPEFGKAS